MSRRRRRKSAGAAAAKALAAGNGLPPAQAQGPEASGPEAQITQYIFTFELIRQYPTVRSFIVKQPLKRSFGDTMSEFFGGNKKGVYRI